MSAASSSSRKQAIHLLRLLFFCMLLLQTFATIAFAAQTTLSVQASAALLADPTAKRAIDDTLALLSRAFPGAVTALNCPHAGITLQLPELKRNRTTVKADEEATRSLPDRSYHWDSRKTGNRTVLQLTAATPEAVACGLYGLLQEQLGIRFVHPRQTLVPTYRHWPLKPVFSFSGKPRFPYQGFHLHTLHPMELTEQLHNPHLPGAFQDVAAYLDWLARNGQNSFQFFLLREVDRTAWIPHIRRIVEYAHERGISCGVEISLAMLQQQAFQAITLLRPVPSYKRQVEETMAWLFQVPWDFITLESMMGEHLPLISRLLPTAQRHLEQLVTGQYRRKVLYATHVISQDKGKKVRRPLCPASGILIHTVMCYSVSEPKAPVYGNRNQQFMLDAAREEAAVRETWYWPESSYWVGFDSSVPLLLLPYLDSRWHDLRVMELLGVSGHLTFSTGWEWGYWLVDWSIARWSWQYSDNGSQRPDGPLSRLADLYPDARLQQLWQQALTLQNRYLKDKELLRLMAAATPFAELPPPFNLPFQPDPEVPLRRLLKKAGDTEPAAALKGSLADLEQYAAAMQQITGHLGSRIIRLKKLHSLSSYQVSLADELITGLQVTALRARHRNLTMQALIAKRRDSMGGEAACDAYLKQAEVVRRQALLLVRQQESRYRYPVELLATRRTSLTAYQFGYLYPTARLFFWEREEAQVRHERFDPLFMNLWDFGRTLGMGSLLWRQP